MEVVKLVNRGRSARRRPSDQDACTNLFRLHDSAHKLQSLQMLPGTQPHSMQIQCRHLINHALSRTLAVLFPRERVGYDDLIRELSEGFLVSFMALEESY